MMKRTSAFLAAIVVWAVGSAHADYEVYDTGEFEPRCSSSGHPDYRRAVRERAEQIVRSERRTSRKLNASSLAAARLARRIHSAASGPPTLSASRHWPGE